MTWYVPVAFRRTAAIWSKTILTTGFILYAGWSATAENARFDSIFYHIGDHCGMILSNHVIFKVHLRTI